MVRIKIRIKIDNCKVPAEDTTTSWAQTIYGYPDCFQKDGSSCKSFGMLFWCNCFTNKICESSSPKIEIQVYQKQGRTKKGMEWEENVFGLPFVCPSWLSCWANLQGDPKIQCHRTGRNEFALSTVFTPCIILHNTIKCPSLFTETAEIVCGGSPSLPGLRGEGAQAGTPGRSKISWVTFWVLEGTFFFFYFHVKHRCSQTLQF